MLTKKFRPQKFQEVQGNEIVIDVLKAICRSPKDSPRSLVLCGDRGLGKTTLSRIFARALNCTIHVDECCNTCPSCKDSSEGGQLYVEYDSAVVGNVETMRSLRDSFGYSVSKGWRVVVFDEAHLNSTASQSSLLKVIEEANGKVFFVFPTTDPQDILPTIISRSIVLKFEHLEEMVVTEYLKKIATDEAIEATDEAISMAVRRTAGLGRDAVQQLEMIKLLGSKKYLQSTVCLDDEFAGLFDELAASQLSDARQRVEKILRQPLEYVKQDFDKFISSMADRVFIEKKGSAEEKKVVGAYLKNFNLLTTTNHWYVFFLSLTALFEEKKAPKVDRFSR